MWVKSALIKYGLLAAALAYGCWHQQPSPEQLQVSGASIIQAATRLRAAGAAPIYRGQPGYRDGLDGDSDGIACEPYHGF